MSWLKERKKYDVTKEKDCKRSFRLVAICCKNLLGQCFEKFPIIYNTTFRCRLKQICSIV